jgi:hypothetical protein
MSIRLVITRLGGISKVARELKHKNVTTVQGWWDRETIPAHRQREVLDLAERIGLPVEPEQIIPPRRPAA